MAARVRGGREFGFDPSPPLEPVFVEVAAGQVRWPVKNFHGPGRLRVLIDGTHGPIPVNTPDFHGCRRFTGTVSHALRATLSDP